MKAEFKEYRPKEISEALWKWIIDSWENGLSDHEAAFRAESKTGEHITADEIQRICRDNPEVGQLRANLHSQMLIDARLVIRKALKGNNRDAIQTARWYAERKAPDEFSTKQAIAFEGAVVELSLEEKEKALKDLMEQFHNGEQ